METTLGAGCGTTCMGAFIKVLLIFIVCLIPFLVLFALMLIPCLLMLLWKCLASLSNCCPKRQRKKIKAHHCQPGDYETTAPVARPPMYNDKPSRGMKAKLASFAKAKTMDQVQAVKE